MSGPRFTTLTPETMTADQKRVADAIQSGPRGAGLRGPFNALLRSPELCDLVQRLGAFVRFGTSIPQRLNEMAIIMAGRKWTAQYEFYAHRRLALEAGLSPAIADAIAANQRVKDAFGERGVVDLVGAVGLLQPGVDDAERRAGATARRSHAASEVRRAAPPRARGHGFQNPCDGMRNARLKREDAFSHAMIIVSSAMVSSS
jgi:alkylhydroperoxidase family enzyme